MRIRGLGVGSIDTVAQTIQTVEGYYPGSLAYSNNNPGNLKFANQSGATGKDQYGFAVFPDYNTGYQALLNQINLDAGRGLTIAQFTDKYAPASDGNNPGAYAQSIAGASGLSVNDPLTMALGGDYGVNAGTGGTGTDWGSIAALAAGIVLVSLVV